MSLLDKVSLVQQPLGATAPAQSTVASTNPRGGTIPGGGPNDSSTLSRLSSVAPPVEMDLQQILAGVMLRQLPKSSSVGSSQSASPSLPTPNFSEVRNPQGVPFVNQTLAQQSVGLAAR